MKKIYKIPIMGTVTSDTPLTGAPEDPLCPIPLRDIMREQGAKGIHGYASLEYNVDEGWVEVEVEGTQEGHAWLEDILPELPQIKEAKGWILDTTELLRRREERADG